MSEHSFLTVVPASEPLNFYALNTDPKQTATSVFLAQGVSIRVGFPMEIGVVEGNMKCWPTPATPST